MISSTEITFIKIISFGAAIQGLAWAVLSFICIVLYYISKDLTFDSTYEQLLESYLYYRFLKDTTASTSEVIRPSDFTIFMWIYFLSSAVWIALSIDQYIAVNFKKNRLSTVMIIWSINMLIFSLLDIILVSLLARDYAACSSSINLVSADAAVNSANIANIYCFLSTGIAMTLAARGYLLWCINVFVAFAVLLKSIQMKKQNYARKNIVIPRPKLTTSENDDWRMPQSFGENNSGPQPIFLRDSNKRFG